MLFLPYQTMMACTIALCYFYLTRPQALCVILMYVLQGLGTLVGQKLSVIALAEEKDDDLPLLELMGVEDGMLLLATVKNFTLCPWSMEAGPSKTAVWAR